MAKLSAHGKELARIKREIVYNPPAVCIGPWICRSERFYSFRTDGHILRRETFYWSDPALQSPTRESWKLWKRAKGKTKQDRRRKLYPALCKRIPKVERARYCELLSVSPAPSEDLQFPEAGAWNRLVRAVLLGIP
jgi:hypothetical protein